jgi:ADP-heptose:LPS heptosyltransferase
VDRGATVLIDAGVGGEETERVEKAIAGLPAEQVRCWRGAFAPFAAAIARSRLYVGYDSAGQHVAAACGVPLVSVFAGFPAPRMFSRWRPAGTGPIEVVKVDGQEGVLERALHAIDRLYCKM